MALIAEKVAIQSRGLLKGSHTVAIIAEKVTSLTLARIAEKVVIQWQGLVTLLSSGKELLWVAFVGWLVCCWKKVRTNFL